MQNKKRFALLGILVVGVLGYLFIHYFIMPVMSLNFFGTLFLLLASTGIIAAILIYYKIKFAWVIPVLVAILVVFKTVSSFAFFNHIKYRNMIGEVKEKDFSVEISPIDLSKLPVVDAELAANLGEKKLGEQVALGSQVTLDEFTLINVKDTLYWVSPLVHTGFFKWSANREGTPGYIQINASNPRDIKLVQEIDGQNLNIKYQRQAYFGDDLKRKVYQSGYKSVGLTDYSFELDDSGKPYWVITKYDKTIGISGNKAIGVIIVDAQTGEISDYDLDNVPQWVDRVIPVDFALKQLNDWGKYVNGWWNPSNKGVLRSTEGYNFIYNNGRAYIYTGLTSSGADESTVGFTLIDTRTKEATFYKVSGSQETAAMQSAEGKVQHLAYEATFPILINVDNHPTYFMTLKDKKGLIKLYAMVNVNDYSIVGTGESVSKTKSDYIKYLKNRGDWQGLGDSGAEKSMEGTIQRIGSSMIEDTTFYYIILNEQPDKIFIASLNISNELPLTKEGDRVKLEYFNNSNSSIDLIKFDNMTFMQTVIGEEEEIIKSNEVLEQVLEEKLESKHNNK
ncbi:cell shape-determining protein [Petroclostridium sp. X23]|uniref:cell shape-determining protein n=1 Tax=Petroclostridium sp. X23 TaxID=3045146 RepID=UPI0024ACF4C8|nr:cell shape-determining protein [Petroclostridium sp. X23]WHH58660.1 cell shape-determining protein [Petroclostridium sp. X23]